MKLVNIGEAQTNLPSLLEDIQHERIVITHEGHPLGVLLSLSDYQDWSHTDDEELTALFSSPEVQEKLQRADADYTAGR